MSRWLVVVALLGGCAFSLEGPDPNRPRNTLPKCDTSKGLVALDAVMATVLGITALGLAAEEQAVALVPLGLGALYTAGAVAGNRAVDSCREALDEYERYDGNFVATEDDDDDDEGTKRNKRGKKLIPRERPAYAGAPVYPGQAGYPPQGQPQQGPPQPGSPPPQYPPPQYPQPQQQPQPQPPQQQSQPQQPAQQPQPQPPQQPAQPPPRPGKKPPAPAPASADEEWSDFWREVP